MPEVITKAPTYPKFKDIHNTNWRLMKPFVDLMMNRVNMGYFRYGPLDKQAKGKYDVIASIRKRLDLFEATGNDEVLVDCANLCYIEFIKGNHPNKHFLAGDDTEHTQEKK